MNLRLPRQNCPGKEALQNKPYKRTSSNFKLIKSVNLSNVNSAKKNQKVLTTLPVPLKIWEGNITRKGVTEGRVDSTEIAEYTEILLSLPNQTFIALYNLYPWY